MLGEICSIEAVLGDYDCPAVLVGCDDLQNGGYFEYTLSAFEAKELAFNLIKAVAVAETELGIVHALAPVPLDTRFSPNVDDGCDKERELARSYADLFDSARRVKHTNIDINIFPNSQSILIKYELGEIFCYFAEKDALDYAERLLECAEMAQLKSFLKTVAELSEEYSEEMTEQFLTLFSESKEQQRKYCGN